MSNSLDSATFGGGCFWCLETVFDRLLGVEKVVSGYAGGHVKNPAYREVCAGTTGHAEVVQITFDPEEISYRDLMEIFLTMHDPTTKDRQGHDVGSQYRSIVLYHDEDQHRIAREVIESFERDDVWSAPIVTELKPLAAFYPAEAYHQNYYETNPSQPYCQAVIAPKVAGLRRKYASRLKPE